MQLCYVTLMGETQQTTKYLKFIASNSDFLSASILRGHSTPRSEQLDSFHKVTKQASECGPK